MKVYERIQVKFTKLLGKPFSTRRDHGDLNFALGNLFQLEYKPHKLQCSTASY
jgi:hypothetical protein